jgi:hypothetical protein
MSKQEKNVTEAQGAEVALANNGNDLVETWANNIKAFSEVEIKDFIELSSSYLKFQENTRYNLVATGLTTFVDDNGEEKAAVSLMNENKESLINANAVLVNSVKKLADSLPAGIVVLTGGKIKGANGSYLSMKVYRAQ